MSNSRRQFLSATGAVAAGAFVSGLPQSARGSGANDSILMGFIGLGGQGTNLATSFAAQKNVVAASVCDPDSDRASRATGRIAGVAKKKPRIESDLRKLLEDDAIDAVTVATPDHWHGPATLLALAHGKHVYVEKPCAHNVREGRLMVDAARKHKRIVQVGTQSRSSQPVIEAMKLLRDGAIGKVLIAKAWNSQRRANIGRAKPSEPPKSLDYDLWVGPAPFVPYQKNRLHYHWHWWYDFGTGDMGNDGVHELDIARWGLGVDTHPSAVSAAGGKFFFDDDQQFPDTQYVAFDYPGDGAVGNRRQLVFEQRIWSPYRQDSLENGNAFYGTNGMLVLGKNDGWKLYGPRNRLIRESKAGGMGEPHHRNFLDCAASGKQPNADIAIGHLSAALCHLGNIAIRTGKSFRFDPDKEQIVDDKQANALIRREYRAGHFGTPQDVER